MSVTRELKRTDSGSRPAWPQWARANVAQFLLLLGRPPRGRTVAALAWRAPLRLVLGAAVVAALVAGTMVTLDAWAIREVQRLPLWLTGWFDELTEFGKAGWLLLPLATVLLVIAALASPSLHHLSRLVLAALAVRLGFVLLAIAVPGLLVAGLKRLIGRARPLVGTEAGPFLYAPFGWNVEYASLPSGHATNVVAAAVAVGALWPRLRPLMWCYAALIAASRVVVTAHHPSDVLAGAAVGVVGALLVRDWFAARRLAFVPDAGGHIHALPGPSFARIRRAARRLAAR